MFENNPLIKLLGIKYPILQGGMNHLSEAKLASVISELGGLGVIGVDMMSPKWLEGEIKKIKELTKKPFAVNLFLRNPQIEELVKVVIYQRVPVVFTHGGNPLPYFFHFQAGGIKVIPIVFSPRLAKKMEDNGADAVSLLGYEASCFFGKNTIFSLIPQTKKIVQKIPIIASSGICDGKGSKAAFLLGADGVQLETRFLASKEAQIPDFYKEKILKAQTDDLEVVLEFTGYPVRVIKNQWAEKMKKLEERGVFPEEIKFEDLRQLLEEKDVDNFLLLADLSVAAISEIKSCQEIIEEIIQGLTTLAS